MEWGRELRRDSSDTVRIAGLQFQDIKGAVRIFPPSRWLVRRQRAGLGTSLRMPKRSCTWKLSLIRGLPGNIFSLGGWPLSAEEVDAECICTCERKLTRATRPLVRNYPWRQTYKNNSHFSLA